MLGGYVDGGICCVGVIDSCRRQILEYGLGPYQACTVGANALRYDQILDSWVFVIIRQAWHNGTTRCEKNKPESPVTPCDLDSRQPLLKRSIRLSIVRRCV